MMQFGRQDTNRGISTYTKCNKWIYVCICISICICITANILPQSLNYFTYQERHFSIKYNNFDICLKVFQLKRQILLPTKYSILYSIVNVSLILDTESNIFHLAIRYPLLKNISFIIYCIT